MEKKLTRNEINTVLWNACDSFRGTLAVDQFKDYILTMLFLKYVTDVWKDKKEFYKKKYGEDKQRIEYALLYERFQLTDECSFDYLYENRAENNLGELINNVLKELEIKNSSGMLRLFSNIDFNNESRLGSTKDRNKRLKKLLVDLFALDLRPSHFEEDNIVAYVYKDLIGRFASESGKKAGEFYSPADVSTLLAMLLDPQPGNRICDPACGSGSLLLKVAQEVGNKNFSLYGQESNGNAWSLARMNMVLHGLDNANIELGDTLKHPRLLEDDQLMKFHVVVANPPFSLENWGVDDALADQYKRFHRGMPPKSKGDYAFITHMIETLREDVGKAGVVVSHGVLFRGSSEGKIREQLIKENLLEAVIGLPANLFYGTGIPAAILIFNKGKGDNKDVLFIDASREFQDERSQKRLRPEDIRHIVNTYKSFKEADPVSTAYGTVIEEKYAYRATLKEIEKNEYNLNIPRYVDVYKEEEDGSILTTQDEIIRLKTELANVESLMAQCLIDLGF